MKKWDEILFSHNAEAAAWELFHENSKTSRYDPPLPTEIILAHMADLWESLPFETYPRIEIEAGATLPNMSLQEAILARATARSLKPCQLSLNQLAGLLHCAYGVTRDNTGTVFPRPFRVVPSGGGLYPLELFFHTAHVEGLSAGFYHFNPIEKCLRLLREGDCSRQLSESLVQPNLPLETSLLIFITAIFERSVFKYGERGYRFALLEAGHVAQNLDLAAIGFGLGAVNIGGYFDRQIDELLGIDGVTHSTVYMVGIGKDEMSLPASERRDE